MNEGSDIRQPESIAPVRSTDLLGHVEPPYTLTPPVPQLPDIWLVEAQHDGKQHTLAMFPIFELPKGVVMANARLFVDAPRMKEQLESIYPHTLEALGSTVETRCYLQKALRLLQEGPIPDCTAVEETIEGALRESLIVLERVQRLYNAQREWPNKQICNL